jgi:hypothetical protein
MALSLCCSKLMSKFGGCIIWHRIDVAAPLGIYSKSKAFTGLQLAN